MADLSLRDVCKDFTGNVRVLHNVNLDVKDGEFMVFVGPSGCGKTTTLRVVAGLEDITSGDVLIDGKSVSDLRAADRGVAMVFQSYALYPHMSVEDNMGFALKMSGESKAQVREQVGKVAEILQLTSLLDRKPKSLSGGQRQRVAIGRAIVRRPKIFLFDEPLSNLDASLRVQMRIELAKLHAELKTTMVYVTHDQTEAMTLGQRIAVFNSGRIEQVGAPLELFSTPANQFVAGFLGSPKMNFIPLSPTDSPTRCRVGAWTHETPSAGVRTLGIRPEDVRVTRDANGMRARVEHVEHLGDLIIVHTRLAESDTRVLAKFAPGPAVMVGSGEDVYLSFSEQSAHWFAENGVAIRKAESHE
jgi:multiple sugar transport system ATP-binding protein